MHFFLIFMCAGDLKGVMRVGAFARGLLLKGECEVELVLMTADKPGGGLFILLSSQLPAKFEVCPPTTVLDAVFHLVVSCR